MHLKVTSKQQAESLKAKKRKFVLSEIESISEKKQKIQKDITVLLIQL